MRKNKLGAYLRAAVRERRATLLTVTGQKPEGFSSRLPKTSFARKLLSLWRRTTYFGTMYDDIARILPSTDTLPPASLRSPTDVQLANRLFEANCGPASLAAILSVQVCDVIALFDQFPERPFTSRRKMEDALRACGVDFRPTETFPKFGVTLIQVEGPWTHAAGSERWTGRYTHWVGICGDTIYDVNADRWLALTEWESHSALALMAAYPKATGWRVKRGLEVTPQEFVPDAVLPGYHFGRRLRAA